MSAARRLTVSALWLRLLAVAIVATLALPQTGFARTVNGRAKVDGTRVYTFTADQAGQVLMTLTWTKKAADLFLLVIDDGDDPLTWCIAAAGQDRTQRCEFGAVRSQRYAIGVSSFRGGSKFALNVQSSDSEFVLGPDREDYLRELSPDDPLHARVVDRMAALQSPGSAPR